MKNKKVYVGATFGLILGAAALSPVLPFPTGAVNVYAAEETGTVVTSYADFYEAIMNSDASVVMLGANIAELNSTLTVQAGRTVTIDLNGYELSLRNGDYRGLVNNGELTIKGGILQNSADGTFNATRGIIDNNGTLVIEDAILRDYGSHNGSAIRNNSEDAVLYFNAGSRLESLNTNNGNVGIAAAKGQVFVADGTEIISYTSGYYPLQVKDGTMTIGTVGSENPAVVSSRMASVYVYGAGNLVVNNAEITSENKQAIKVETNDAKVEINGGKFSAPYGGVYIYTTATETDPIVTINGGDFSGEWASVVSTNHEGSLETWALEIKGGVYAGTRIRNYLSDGYKAYRKAGYFENGWAGYFVDGAAEENIPATIYMKKGSQVELGLSDVAKKYATVTMDKEGVLILDDGLLTSGKTGIVKITTNLNDGSEPIETIVYSYENLLSVELVEADRFSEEEIALLNASLNAGEEKVGYLDVTYARVIDGVEIERISETDEPVTILVEMPELPAVAEGYKRSYRVLHYHDGVVSEVSGATMNEATAMLGFETSSFSPFLVTYLDTEIPVEPEAKPGEGDNNEDPKQPLIPKDNTFDFDDPADVDPLGEVYIQATIINEGKAVKVPNTSAADSVSEINLLIAMMTGSIIMTAAVLGIKKRI